jgi:hypothetical protein
MRRSLPSILVFFSDNGFLFGDHGLIDKRNAYEPSVRVPMVVYGPGRIPPGEISSRVTNLDIAPTMLGFAGLEPAGQMEGQSLVPLLTGAVRETDWQAKPFVYEYYWEWTFPQTPTTFAITYDEIKYIQYHGLWDLEELYDLSKDPGERVNLIHDEAYLKPLVERRAALYQALANEDGKRVVPFREKRAQGLRFRHAKGAEGAKFPASFVRTLDAPDLRSGFNPPTINTEKRQGENKWKYSITIHRPDGFPARSIPSSVGSWMPIFKTFRRETRLAHHCALRLTARWSWTSGEERVTRPVKNTALRRHPGNKTPFAPCSPAPRARRRLRPTS